MLETKQNLRKQLFLRVAQQETDSFCTLTLLFSLSFLPLFSRQCINNEARKAGITKTLDLPDRTLQFIKDKPLMDQAIQPIDNKPLLVQRGSAFTRIIVNEVQAADGNKYKVMFIGTGACSGLQQCSTLQLPIFNCAAFDNPAM